ncbi:hypothetical protein SAY86_003027 [Trapa natans]|uniref:Uncharacterized protein n=1 Tax=Trapa natans TaxID=22666 RepID=A0AAN7LS74_TRANT|nr:hypothetical protein SAY86_003027 [Trapa natans]
MIIICLLLVIVWNYYVLFKGLICHHSFCFLLVDKPVLICDAFIEQKNFCDAFAAGIEGGFFFSFLWLRGLKITFRQKQVSNLRSFFYLQLIIQGQGNGRADK